MRRVADLKPGDVVTAEPPWTFRAVASVDGPWTWVFTDTGPRRIPSGAILWLDGSDPPEPLRRRTPPARLPGRPRQLLKLSRPVYNQCVRLANHAGASTCHYCGKPLDLRAARQGVENRGHLPDWWPTRDHVIPRSAGGHNGDDNLVLSCKRCNSDKGDTPYDVFMARRGLSVPSVAALDAPRSGAQG